MLAIKFSHILNARGIENHFSFLVDSGFTRHTASNLLHSETRSFRLDHIEHLCRILVCEPNDIVWFYPSNNNPLPDQHPLNNLIKSDEQGKTIKNSLRQLPYKDLMTMSDQIDQAVNHKKDEMDNTVEPV